MFSSTQISTAMNSSQARLSAMIDQLPVDAQRVRGTPTKFAVKDALTILFADRLINAGISFGGAMGLASNLSGELQGVIAGTAKHTHALIAFNEADNLYDIAYASNADEVADVLEAVPTALCIDLKKWVADAFILLEAEAA